MSQSCPMCGLFNPPQAQRCDCGYDFAAAKMQKSYLQTDQVVIPAAPREIVKLAKDQRTFVRFLIFELAAWPVLFLAIGVLHSIVRNEFVTKCAIVGWILSIMLFRIVVIFILASNLETQTAKVAPGSVKLRVAGFGPVWSWMVNSRAVDVLRASGVQTGTLGVSNEYLQNLPASLGMTNDE